MITLLLDGLIALVKTIDRGLSAVENVRLRATPQPVVVAQPAAGGDFTVSAATGGGHPDRKCVLCNQYGDDHGYHGWHPATWTDSELLSVTAELLCGIEGADYIHRELNNRAAQFAAQGD